MSKNRPWPPQIPELQPVLLLYGSLSTKAGGTWKEAAKQLGSQVITTERFDECLLHAAGPRPICLVSHLTHTPADASQLARVTSPSDSVFRRVTVILLTETIEQADQWGRIAWDALLDSSTINQAELALAASIETARLRIKDQELVAEYYRRHSELTPEESVVLDAVCEGKLNKQIAGELTVSIRTVEQRRRRVFEKMGVESAIPLAAQVATVNALKHQSSRRDLPAIPSPPSPSQNSPPPPHTNLFKKKHASQPLPNTNSTENNS